MAIFFPTPAGYTLNPRKSAEMLQGFANIMGAEGSVNGLLTKDQVEDYGKKQFVAADPNSQVFKYIQDNYDFLSAIDGDASSLSANDLTQVGDRPLTQLIGQGYPASNASSQGNPNNWPPVSNAGLPVATPFVLQQQNTAFGQPMGFEQPMTFGGFNEQPVLLLMVSWMQTLFQSFQALMSGQ